MTKDSIKGSIPYMIWTRETLLNFIEERRAELGWSWRRISTEVEKRNSKVKNRVTYDNLKDFKSGDSDMLRGDKLSQVLDVLLPANIKSGEVPVLGYVGAGEKVFPFDDLSPSSGFAENDISLVNCEFVEAPPGGAYRNLVALKVKGDSMEPLLCEGSYVYYERRNDGGCDELLNKLSVVELKDGSVYVKILKRGFGYGRYNLQSTNTPKIIEDVELQWCAKVVFIKPA